MAETIQVFYKKIGDFAGISYYHQTLVYTNSNGDRFVASAFPTSSSGNTENDMFRASAVVRAAEGISTGFGRLETVTGGEFDATLRQALGGDDAMTGFIGPNVPHETVTIGSSLALAWSKIVQVFADIQSRQYDYSPVTLNSNSAANTGLFAIGASIVANTGIFGDYWSPADHLILGTSLTEPAGSDYFYTPLVDSSGNSRVTLVERDAAGNTTGVLKVDDGANTAEIASSEDSDPAISILAQNPDWTDSYIPSIFVDENDFDDDSAAIGASGPQGFWSGHLLNLDGIFLTLAPGAEASVSGGGNTISASSGSTLKLTGSGGNFNGVTATNAIVNVGVNSQANFSGTGNTITEDVGASLGVGGGGNTIFTVNGSLTALYDTYGGSDVVYANGVTGQGATANGQSTGIYLNDNANINVGGDDNHFIIAGVNAALGAFGNGTSVYSYGSNDVVNLFGDYGSATLYGDGSSSSSDGTAVNHSLLGTNQVADVGGDHSGVYSTSSSNTAYLHGYGNYGNGAGRFYYDQVYQGISPEDGGDVSGQKGAFTSSQTAGASGSGASIGRTLPLASIGNTQFDLSANLARLNQAMASFGGQTSATMKASFDNDHDSVVHPTMFAQAWASREAY